ncbi:single-stranded-DNA-specific exonuclease RecJ [bacterium]|jgi:single-stranded-DNA-specific exonuclease|nr:single-stranded-DNA-specific exonuclease RecJ [bacterium]
MSSKSDQNKKKQFLHGQKYVWQIPYFDTEKVCDISGKYNFSFPIAQVLFSRGFIDNNEIDSFLFTSFERDVSHPSLLKDAQKAVDRILKAIENKESILVCGDYDVDGVTSTAMMMLCLLPLGAKINFFLPHRERDGYGLSEKIVKRAAKNKYSVIITVDNGITSFEAAKMAKDSKIDLIITDHHKPHSTLPEACAIVNPNQKECVYPCKILAGVGVAFKVLSLLYEDIGRQLPPKVYELLMLGTIADVVPLLDENRYWVRHGLAHVNKNESEALRVLKSNSGLNKPQISSIDVAFNVAPQINALGRLKDARQGVQFLIGSDKKTVESVGTTLWELNQARKEVERSIINDVEQIILSKQIDVERENIIMAAHDNWPSGVIGLVASRLVESYGRPAFLFHLTKDGKAKGSCRSIEAFNIFMALQECEDILDRFGGHSHAAGLSLPKENLPILKERLEKMILEQLTPFDLQQKLKIDAQVLLPDVTKKIVSDLQLLEPFGCKNKQPVFYIKDVVLVAPPKLLKGLHVRCKVFADGVTRSLIFFNRPDIFDALLSVADGPFSVAAYVRENFWNAQQLIELQGVDIAFNDGEKDDNNN